MPSPSITLRGWDDGNFEKLLWLRRERIVIQAKISANAEKERERDTLMNMQSNFRDMQLKIT